MRILNRLGGIELSKAYAVIKAISKKVEEKIAGSRVDFVTGCKKNGVDEAIAEEIFDKIVLFASYGFNKSHSTAYALISYQTAYLKSHYMAEFMAAMLSSEMDEGSKRKLMVEHIEDARSLGIKVLPPDVNTSLAEFGASNNCVSFGLTAIKGLGRGAADKIVLARNEGGKFKDFYDFTERLDRGAVSKLGIERLAMAGALDEFGRRTALMAVMSQAFRSADKHAHDRSRGQKDIFELSINDIEASGGSAKGLPDLPEWPDAEKLKFEKEALSFYFSGHPLSQHEIELSRFRTHGAVQAVKLASYSSVLLAGMVAAVQARTLQSNRKRWAMFQLEDFTGRCKCILWPETYAQHKELLIEDTVLLFEGYVKRQDGNSTDGDVIIRNVLGIEAAKQRVVRELVLRMPYGEDDESLSKLDLIGSVLNRHRGLTPVLLSVSDPQGKQVTLKLGASFRVNTTNLRVEDLEAIVGLGSVLFII